MSGAEAIFGVISGGAGLLSLGIQLSESATKLKRIFSAAKNAPQTISRHIFSLETMALALQELEQHRQHDAHGGALLARCIMACRESTFQIQQLVDKMEHYMTAYDRVGGKLYTVYKEREVKELFEDLERAKSSLELAYMIYLAAEQRRRDQAHSDTLALHNTLLSGLQGQVSAGNADISQRLTGFLQSLKEPQQAQLVVSDGNTAIARESMLTGEVRIKRGEAPNGHDDLKQCGRPRSVRQVQRRKSKNSKAHIRIRLPSQLCSYIWEFAITSDQSRCSMHLYTYNIVPPNSLIFRYCELGDIAVIQRLIQSGEGSLLDTMCDEYEDDRNWTLLERAAQYGQLEVCRYLLNQIDSPDHAAVLSRALSWTACSNGSKSTVDMYRLFLQAPSFDADLEDTERVYEWLRLCPDSQCMGLILENLRPRFFSLSLEARFDLAVRVGLRDAYFRASDDGTDIAQPSFLKCIGLRQSDQRLALLRSSSGTSVLHYIARLLWYNKFDRFPKDEIQGWLDLGQNVLKNGADPFCLARRRLNLGLRDINNYSYYRGDKGWQSTPLMDALDMEYWGIPRDSTYWLGMTLKTIQIWAEMLQQAGIDLCDYGDKESQVWKSLGIEDYSGIDQEDYPLHYSARVGKLIYGSTPTDWSLMIRWPISISIFRLHPPPGAFPKNHNLPITIIWPPMDEERNEGPWEITGERRLQPKHLDLRDVVVEPKEPFEELVDGVQDDLGVIMLMHHRASRPRGSASRSHSQPRGMDHREVAYGEMRNCRRRYDWLGTYHQCPFDSQWRLGFIWRDIHDPHRHASYYEDPRSCTEGISNERHSVQESWWWGRHSFLGHIAMCQDNEKKYDWGWRGLPRSMRHTATRNCAQGCSKVHLDRIQVPEALRHFHPRRIYGEDLGTEGDEYEGT